MGLFDKVKEQAGKAMVQAQDLKGKVGDKVDEVQGKRKADDLLDDLGRFLYAERTGRPVAGADAEITRIVNELSSLEADGIAILTSVAESPEAAGAAGAAGAADPSDPPAASPLPPDLPA